jgi:hypothetical protein
MICPCPFVLDGWLPPADHGTHVAHTLANPRDTLMIGFVVRTLAIAASVTLTVVATPVQEPLEPRLPYDRTNHVWYDNDFANDYIDWYVMTNASAGDIVLRGITTTHILPEQFDWLLEERARVIANGRSSGFRRIPEALPGASRAMVEPASGQIEETVAVTSAGIASLVWAAHATYAETGKPLVVCVGGPLTTIANAYLTDPSIAEKMIVVFVDNYDKVLGGYNGQSDPWAANIVLQRMRLVYFPIYPRDTLGAIPRVSKSWIAEHLPVSAGRDHLLSLKLDIINGDDGDADGMSVISVLAQRYAQAVKRVSFGGWQEVGPWETRRRVPALKDDELGTALMVTDADPHLASAEYHRALLNWGRDTEVALAGDERQRR